MLHDHPEVSKVPRSSLTDAADRALHQALKAKSAMPSELVRPWGFMLISVV